MSDIAHQPCPYTACGSSDAFSYNTDGYGKCHACNKGYPSRDQMFEWAKEKYPTKKGETVADVFETFTPKRIDTPSDGKWVAMRGITAQTMEDYGVKTYSDRQEYVYPSGGIKVRTIPEKAFYAKNGFKGDELFCNIAPSVINIDLKNKLLFC